MCLFKETADIKTADQLDLPTLKANYHNITVKPTEMQKKMVAALNIDDKMPMEVLAESEPLVAKQPRQSLPAKLKAPLPPLSTVKRQAGSARSV